MAWSISNSTNGKLKIFKVHPSEPDDEDRDDSSEDQPPASGQDLPAVKQGVPTDEELEDLGQSIGIKWEQLGRRLNFSDEKLQEIDLDKRFLSQKAYQMLKEWKHRDGPDATYQNLYAALSHKFVSRKDLAEKYCK
ncbi:ankyrin-3-like isoform X1 [Stylophora pistillata]|uniref:ankyrin-3-like isoform X1 n=1 Tax=Stylophora pistillata TaxID=50429 RepID=UPI000C04BD0A|nr:ankyrin-3-like isoform X1 [Stylophora pistillata]XP_022808879.1 ankyrin-3-like isoform X1 [Stylophora pistillata]